jgi:hypothetical protein
MQKQRHTHNKRWRKTFVDARAHHAPSKRNPATLPVSSMAAEDEATGRKRVRELDDDHEEEVPAAKEARVGGDQAAEGDGPHAEAPNHSSAHMAPPTATTKTPTGPSTSPPMCGPSSTRVEAEASLGRCS